MADDSDYGESNSYNSRQLGRFDPSQQWTSKDTDRIIRRRDEDHLRGQSSGSRNSRRRSRSRSGSRERSSSYRGSGRDRGREGDGNDRSERNRRYRDSDDEGEYGNSRRRSRDSEDPKQLGKRDRESRRDEDLNERICGQDWRSKLTSIRDAHFNRNKQVPFKAKNQFKNDGSFMEMFKKKMAEQSVKGNDKSLTPNSLVLASSSIPFSPDLSLPPLTTASLAASQSRGVVDPEDEDVDGVPMPAQKSIPVPVSVGKRRLAKPLKTGMVMKKPQEPEEDEASQEKLDSWARYLQEVQKYRASNCMEEETSRPLVK